MLSPAVLATKPVPQTTLALPGTKQAAVMPKVWRALKASQWMSMASMAQRWAVTGSVISLRSAP